MGEPNSELIGMELGDKADKARPVAESEAIEGNENSSTCFNCLPLRYVRHFKIKSSDHQETNKPSHKHSGSFVAGDNEIPPPSPPSTAIDPKPGHHRSMINDDILDPVDTSDTTSPVIIENAMTKDTGDPIEYDDISTEGNNNNTSNIPAVDSIPTPPTMPDNESTNKMATTGQNEIVSDDRIKKTSTFSMISETRSNLRDSGYETCSTSSNSRPNTIVDSGFDSTNNSRRGTIAFPTLCNVNEENEKSVKVEASGTDIATTRNGNAGEQYSKERMTLSNPNNDTKQANELERILTKLTELSRNQPPEVLARKRISLKNFVAAFLTRERGGLLSISQANCRRVSLFIPPGALPEADEPQLVYIYIPPTSEMAAKGTQSNQAWITPKVRCGPSGLQFFKPIFLTVPYKSAIDSTSLQILSYQKKKSTGNNWKQSNEGQDAVTVAQKNEVTVLLNHFCDYGCTGVSESCKWMQVTVSAERTDAETCDIFVNLCDRIDEVSLSYQQRIGNVRI